MPAKQVEQENQILVADIGGTNARLAIAGWSASNNRPELTAFKTFPCADYHALGDLLSAYLQDLGKALPKQACLAVAGPVANRKAHITNLGWHLDANELEKQFGFNTLHLTNDFAALARSTPILTKNDIITLRPGAATPLGPVSVMGPGTGFGLAILVPHTTGCSIISSEGGHISFMPTGILETRILQSLIKSMGRVTVETLLSGIGIMRIYRELCHIRQVTPMNYDPRTISNQALDHEDSICLETLKVFCSMMGSVAGDMALAQGATGGVYLGGGILPKIADFLSGSRFTERFLDKPPMQDFISKIPLHLITAPDAALKGAALLFQDNHTSTETISA